MGDAVLELADLEQVRRRARRRDQDPEPRDAVLEADPIGDDDLQKAADPSDRVQAWQVVGDGDRAFLLPPQPAQPSCLGRLGGTFRVMAEAVRTVMQWRHPAWLAVRLGVGTTPR